MTESGAQHQSKRQTWLGPAAALIGPYLAVMVALMLIGVCAMGWWSIQSERSALASAGNARIESLAQLLADSTHATLSDGDLTAARRLLAEAGRQVPFKTCRIEMPDGSVLADQVPSEVTVHTLPDTWPGGQLTDEVIQHPDNGSMTVRLPIHLPGRGTVLLHVVGESGLSASAVEAGTMTPVITAGIAGGLLIVCLLLWRPIRQRITPFVLIREALLSIEQGETEPAALMVGEQMDAEVRAWNRLVDRHGEQEKVTLLERALESAASDEGGAGSFAQIGDALWHGVVLVSTQLRITYANGAAGVLLKNSRDNMLNAEAADLFVDPRVVELLNEAAQSADGRRRMHETTNQQHGQLEALRYCIRLIGEGPNKKLLVVIEDITQQRVAEQTRRDFVAQVAHELRTPLTNISLNTEAAVSDGQEDAELRGRCLNVINQETQRLAQVVNDMLSVSEIEAGSMTLRQDDIRLDALFADLAEDFRQQAEDKQVSLRFDLPPKLPVIQGDRDKLAISLHNLLGNAIKYTLAGGEVVVSVSAEEGELSVAFKDKGIGIGKEDLEKVFDRFYRAKDSRVAGITGTGLGLPIAREVVRRHGGDIEATSELNQGSTFTVHLPYKPEAA